jgi:hypothetical protein
MLGRRFGGARTNERVDPISLLKDDHKKVKELFEQFERADDEVTQLRLARTTIDALKVHSAIEEEIFYPAVEGMLDDRNLIVEAIEEHHVVHLLVNELEQEELEPEVFHAKFTVLAENVRRHIKEEEDNVMPKIDGEPAELAEIGKRMAARKDDLTDEAATVYRGFGGGGRKKGSGAQRAPGAMGGKHRSGGNNPKAAGDQGGSKSNWPTRNAS